MLPADYLKPGLREGPGVPDNNRSMEHEQLVGEARERERLPMPARERMVAVATAVVFLAAAAGVAVLVPHNRPLDLPLAAGLLVLTAVGRTVRFEIGNAEACADQLVFVCALFLVPLPLVLPLTACAYVLSRLPDFVRGRVHQDRWLYCPGDALNALGPVAVLAALAPGPLGFSHVWVYALALAAQIPAMLAVLVPNDYLLYRASPLETARLLMRCARIDLMLSPLGFMVAAVAESVPLAVLSVVPLIWLIATFSRERRARYAAAIELSQAYRGTVMVLADLVEADDGYTAAHCRSVVDLATMVADELGLDPSARQELEMAALLHDVGKIAIPNEILNKPGRLTKEEFELMKTHTVEGQALLDRVGGRLARVGQIVRACHERWDGAGYPDGLRGEEIPVAARIVFGCDAYSAMTTDRPYRKAMSHAEAMAELRRNSGTQFEPRVVDALEVLSKFRAMTDGLHSDGLRVIRAAAAVDARV